MFYIKVHYGRIVHLFFKTLQIIIMLKLRLFY